MSIKISTCILFIQRQHCKHSIQLNSPLLLSLPSLIIRWWMSTVWDKDLWPNRVGAYFGHLWTQQSVENWLVAYFGFNWNCVEQMLISNPFLYLNSAPVVSLVAGCRHCWTCFLRFLPVSQNTKDLLTRRSLFTGVWRTKWIRKTETQTVLPEATRRPRASPRPISLSTTCRRRWPRRSCVRSSPASASWRVANWSGIRSQVSEA